MGTTNDPLQGGPTPSPAPHADPVNQLAPKAPGQPSHDDHDTSGPPAPEVIARGYEEDVYDTKTVLSVPLLVLLFFVLAFGTTTLLFSAIAYRQPDPRAHPQAAERNKKPLSDRIRDIGGEKDQPVRLDQLDVRSGEARAITRPKEPEGNSPQIHPEDLILSPAEFPKVYALVTRGPDAGGLFPSSGQELPTEASRYRPTGSNAGRGAEGSVAVPPRLPAVAKVEPKKDDTKKDPPKKDEPKKDDPKKEPGKETKK